MTDLMLTPRERAQLRALAQRADDGRLSRRAYALLWQDGGKPVSAIAEQLGLSRQTIYGWLERFAGRVGQGMEARLADAPRSGRPCTAAGIIDPLIDGVIETDPRDLGYSSTVWTAPLLVTYLSGKHQLSVSCQSVRLAIARLRIRWKRPRHQLALRPDTWQQAKGG
jgi:transposase